MGRIFRDDGEVKDGSPGSSNADPMDTVTGVTVSLLGKRGADALNPEDTGESSGGSEEEGDEDEEIPESKEEDSDSGPEWGYDSMDDRKFDSSDERKFAEDCGNDEHEMKWVNYKRKVIETKGFFDRSETVGFPHGRFSGIACLNDLEADAGHGLTVREFCSKLTSLCLERYNQEKGLNVKLEHIVRANFDPGPKSKYYITFAARVSDSPDGLLEEYQAKALWCVGGKSYPIFCRPSPLPQKGS